MTHTFWTRRQLLFWTWRWLFFGAYFWRSRCTRRYERHKYFEPLSLFVLFLFVLELDFLVLTHSVSYIYIMTAARCWDCFSSAMLPASGFSFMFQTYWERIGRRSAFKESGSFLALKSDGIYCMNESGRNVDTCYGHLRRTQSVDAPVPVYIDPLRQARKHMAK